MTWGCQASMNGTPLRLPFFRHCTGVAPCERYRRHLLTHRPLNLSKPTRTDNAKFVGQAVLSSESSVSGIEQASTTAKGSRPETHASLTHPSSTSSGGRSIGPESSLPASQENPDSSSAVKAEDLLELGCFGAPHGVRGDIRLFPTTDSAKERLTQPGLRWTLPREVGASRRGHVPKEVEIIRGRPILQKGKEVWLLRVKGFNSPEAADMLKGLRLLMPASDRPPLDSDEEFYVQELIGMQVIMHTSGEHVGSVVDVYDGTGTHDVLRIALKAEGAPSAEEREQGERTTLLPFASEMVPVVDRASRRMEITPPEGLLDIVTTAKKPSAQRQRL
ncbi:g13009 [Coccomyxa viridis]|uniref:G13009 protein n=1 Tax=Coccomyxa viridis TaxID=1274662 RepID=A0ABP1GED3_9CHLO